MTDEPSLRGRCDCCGYGAEDPDDPKAVALHRIRANERMGERGGDVCDVCWRTMVGGWYQHFRVTDATTLALGRLIAWGINYLRDQGAR
jgi:hypothetical protein